MRRTFHFKTLCLLLSILWMFGKPVSIHAWGPEGHQIVARIATRHLKATTVKFIDTILRSDPNDLENCAKKRPLEDRMACISLWADDIRRDPRFQYTRNQHFVDIPIYVPAAERHYNPARDCRNDDCIVVAIEKYSRTLADRKAPSATRALALKFLVHFMGDLHQPLHVATDRVLNISDAAQSASDLGGNRKLVNWMGQSSDEFGCLNLHEVWDRYLLMHNKGVSSDQKYAAELMASHPREKIRALQQGTVLEWVDESYRLAIDHAYGLLPEPREESCEQKTEGTCGPCSIKPQDGTRYRSRYYLNEAYYEKNRSVVDLQLIRAGLRLARVLDLAALGK
jgi:hypothetical protein